MMPLPPSEFFKLPMIRQASKIVFVTQSLTIFYFNKTISTEELLDFLKDGPENKSLTITENFLKDGHVDLLRKLRKVS
jgi:hypothetical protein